MQAITRKHHVTASSHQHNNFQRKRQRRKVKLVLLIFVVLVISASLLLTIVHSGTSSSDEPSVTINVQDNFSFSSLASVENKLWKENTLSLLDKTHLWSGTFTGNFTAATKGFDPYTTYYVLLTYQKLGEQAPNKAATINALRDSQRTDGHFACELPSPGKDSLQIDQVGCIYYTVLSLHTLGSEPKNIPAIIKTLNSLQVRTGAYAYNTSVFHSLNMGNTNLTTDLLTAREAIAVLNLFGFPLSNRTALQNWLLSEWEQGASLKQDPSNQIAFLASIAESLDALGTNVHHLPLVSLYLGQVQNTCSHALDLKRADQPGNPFLQTNLFFITNCLKVEQLLPGSSSATNQLLPALLAELTTFQQTCGGFNVFFMSTPDRPDIQGTYLAVSLFKENHQIIPKAKDILALLNQQARDQGGFLPVSYTPRISTIITYQSLQMRVLLGAPGIDITAQMTLKESVSDFIQHLSTYQPVKVEEIYYTLLLAKYLGLDTTSLLSLVKQYAIVMVESLHNDQPLNPNQLQDVYYFSKMVRFNSVARSKVINAILLMENESGAFVADSVAGLEYTWQALSAINAIAPEALANNMRQRTLNWINQRRTLNGGFAEQGIVNVYSSYWAIESLHLLTGKFPPSSQVGVWLRSLEAPIGGIMPQVGPQSDIAFSATYDTLLLTQQLRIAL